MSGMNKCPLTGQPCNSPRLYKITEIDNGKVKSLELCHKCFANYVVGESPKPPQKDDLKKVPAVQALATFLEFLTGGGTTSIQPNPKTAVPDTTTPCPKCGASFEDMIRTEKVGCAHCYDHFGDVLNVVLKRLQKTELKHVGKVPKNWKNKKAAERDIGDYLKDEKKTMAIAVKEEDYERAAILRDKIAAVEALQERLKDAISDEDFEQAKLIRDEIQKFIDHSSQANP
jgi:protein arginine kinase activator